MRLIDRAAMPVVSRADELAPSESGRREIGRHARRGVDAATLQHFGQPAVPMHWVRAAPKPIMSALMRYPVTQPEMPRQSPFSAPCRSTAHRPFLD